MQFSVRSPIFKSSVGHLQFRVFKSTTKITLHSRIPHHVSSQFHSNPPRGVRDFGVCLSSKKDALSEVALDPEDLDPVVGQVMNRDVIFLRDSQTVRDAIQMFLSSGISGAPVLDLENKLIGVLSETDIIRSEAGVIDALKRASWSSNNLNLEQLPEEFKKKPKTKLLLDTRVKEVMTTDPISISATMPIVEAAILMINSQVNRLPVVEDGRVVGVLSRGDILQCMIWEILMAGSTVTDDDDES